MYLRIYSDSTLAHTISNARKPAATSEYDPEMDYWMEIGPLPSIDVSVPRRIRRRRAYRCIPASETQDGSPPKHLECLRNLLVD
jgi:hypothetical protein